MIDLQKLKEMVKDNKKVYFVEFFDGDFHYKTECGFKYVVPISDTKGAKFLAQDKALYHMRWLRKQLDLNERLSPNE